MNMHALLLTTNRGRQSSVLRWILKWYVRESSAAVKSLDDLLEDHAVTQIGDTCVPVASPQTFSGVWREKGGMKLRHYRYLPQPVITDRRS
jgi:hypothetical protein